jgi:hypothetical protein
VCLLRIQRPPRVCPRQLRIQVSAKRKSTTNFAKNPQNIYEYIDVWSGVCVFFVFSALLEYALVNYASRSVRKKIRKHFRTKSAKNIQGHRCVERSVRLLCIQRSPRVCPRQLRIQVSAEKIRKKIHKKSAKNLAKNHHK